MLYNVTSSDPDIATFVPSRHSLSKWVTRNSEIRVQFKLSEIGSGITGSNSFFFIILGTDVILCNLTDFNE